MVKRLVPAVLAATACSGSMASPFRPLPGEEPRAGEPRAGESRAAEVHAGATRPVGQLPYARGRTFATLDDYLAFRREQGAIDLPWYKEVAPGLFELQTSIRPAPPRERLTRAQLARKFGFDR